MSRARCASRRLPGRDRRHGRIERASRSERRRRPRGTSSRRPPGRAVRIRADDVRAALRAGRPAALCATRGRPRSGEVAHREVLVRMRGSAGRWRPRRTSSRRPRRSRESVPRSTDGWSTRRCLAGHGSRARACSISRARRLIDGGARRGSPACSRGAGHSCRRGDSGRPRPSATSSPPRRLAPARGDRGARDPTVLTGRGVPLRRPSASARPGEGRGPVTAADRTGRGRRHPAGASGWLTAARGAAVAKRDESRRGRPVLRRRRRRHGAGVRAGRPRPWPPVSAAGDVARERLEGVQ